jgi:putative addiction module component (TIGR02574 family)
MPADTVAHMSKPVDRIQQEIRDLSTAEKEEVLHTLLDELDGPPDEEVEAAWLAEVERRGREIDNGTVQCIPATEVFSRLDKILGK